MSPSSSAVSSAIDITFSTVGGAKIYDRKFVVTEAQFDKDGVLMIQKGKKVFHRVVVK